MTRTDADPTNLDDLQAAIERLTDQVASLTAAIDDLTEQATWHNNNRGGQAVSSGRPFQLTSMPLDPAAQDWQINRYSAADLPG